MPDPNYEELSGPELDSAIRKRIENRMRARTSLYIHAIVFIGVNLLLWTVWFTTDRFDIPWPLFAALPWGMALAIHAMVVYQGSGSATERRNQQIQREIELEKARLGLSSEKQKRTGAVRLSDDGELISDDDIKAKRDRSSSDRRA